MGKDPAFLFYSQDFIVGVQTMCFEDRGKYITILSQMHQQGRMNEETIRFLVGNVSVMLKSKFSIDENGFWYNARLEEEISKRVSFVESRRANGLKGGRPNKASGKPNAKPSGKARKKLVENENENENKDVFYRSFNHLSISEEEYKKLTDIGYSKRQIDDILDRIENYKDNKKYKSLYLTAKTWLKKETPENKANDFFDVDNYRKQLESESDEQ
jgi:hypothetical protein